MTQPSKIVLIAALEREISGLVKGWEEHQIELPNRQFKAKYWRHGDAVALAVGMGWEKAFAGTKVAIEAFRPELVTSIGFSGSLVSELKVADILVPAQVIGSKTGAVHPIGTGTSTLVTVPGVVGGREKAELAVQFGAHAVDMEAAAVAESCKAAGVRFAAIRSISDGIGDEMDFVGRFVAPDGFRTGAFVAYIAIRPQLWGALVRLAANSQRAADSLTKALQEFVLQPERFLQTRSIAGVEDQGAASLARK